MKKLSIDDHVTEESCGPLTIQYRITNYRKIEEDRVVVEWFVCPDDEDKNHERAFLCGEIEGRATDFDAIAARAIDECRAAVIMLSNTLLAWVQQQLNRSLMQTERQTES